MNDFRVPLICQKFHKNCKYFEIIEKNVVSNGFQWNPNENQLNTN